MAIRMSGQKRQIRGTADARGRIGVVHKRTAKFDHEGSAAKPLDIRQGFEQDAGFGGGIKLWIHRRNRQKTMGTKGGRWESGEIGRHRAGAQGRTRSRDFRCEFVACEGIVHFFFVETNAGIACRVNQPAPIGVFAKPG